MVNPRESLQLWVSPIEGLTLAQRLERLARLRCVNDSLDDCLKGKISFMDFLDIADANGVDIEDYLSTLEHNLTIGLGIDLDTLPQLSFYQS